MAFADSLRDENNPPTLGTVKTLIDNLVTALENVANGGYPKVLFSFAEEISVVDDASETTLVNYTIPGGKVDQDHGIRVSARGTIDSPRLSTVTFNIRLYFGGTKISDMEASLSLNANSFEWQLFSIIQNSNNLADQTYVTEGRISEAFSVTGVARDAEFIGINSGTTSVNTATGTDLELRILIDDAFVQTGVTLESFMVELV